MEILSQEVILNNLPADMVVSLCDVSPVFRRRCAAYLQNRIIGELGDPSIILNPQSPIRDFIRIMSLADEDFVVRGSEDFVGTDEALYRAVKTRNERLIDYFCGTSELSACNPRYIRLIALASLLEGDPATTRRLLREYDIGKDFARILVVIASKLGEDLGINITPIYGEAEVAKIYDSPSMVKRLIQVTNVYPSNLVYKAAGGGNLNVIRYLLGLNPELELQSALRSAAGEGHLNVVRYLLELNPKLELRSALLDATSGGHLDVIKYLLRKNPNLNLRHALNLAVSRKDLDIIKYFLEIDPDIDLRGLFRNATRREYFDLADYFLEVDPDINLQDQVELAASEDHPRAIEYLLKKNPNLNLQSALDIAATEYSLYAIDYLLEVDPDLDINLRSRGIREKVESAAFWGELELVKFFIERIPKINLTRIIRNAVRGNQLDVVKYLAKTYPKLINKHLLDLAKEERKPSIVSFLEENL